MIAIENIRMRGMVYFFFFFVERVMEEEKEYALQ